MAKRYIAKARRGGAKRRKACKAKAMYCETVQSKSKAKISWRIKMKYYKDPDPDYPEPDSDWPFETDGYEN